MSNNLIVATANLQEGKMLHAANGLDPFIGERPVDALLMQEVLWWDQGELEERLATSGFALACFDKPTALAIAVRDGSEFQVQEDSQTIEILQEAEKIGEFIRGWGISIGQRLRPRGLVATKLTDGDQEVTVATTHPIIFLRSRARNRQLDNIVRALQLPYYENAPLIIGGDMNHYPDARKNDKAMRAAANLLAIELDEPTWRIAGSRHEWAAKIGATVARRALEDFDARLDAILYRGLEEKSHKVVDIESDHRAIIAEFSLVTRD